MDSDKRENCGPNTFEECREKGERLERQGNAGCCWGGINAKVQCYHKKMEEKEDNDNYNNYDSHFNHAFSAGGK